MKITTSSIKRSCILILLVLLGTKEILSSENIPVINDYFSIQEWQADDGLPRNTIHTITQSPDGFIWMGTRFSLIRFDGIEFKEYGLQTDDQISRVRYITFNDEGELFFAPANQIVKKFANGNYSNLSISGGGNFDFHCVATGPDNTIWAIDRQGVIYKVVGESLIDMVVLEADFQHDVLFKINIEQDGTIWFSRGEFYGYFRPGEEPKIWRLPNEFIRLSLSSDGSVWMLTRDELRQLVDKDSGETHHILTLPVEKSWGSDLMVDSRMRIWMCVDNRGLYLWENNELKRFDNIPNRFWSIFEDEDGSIWIGLGGDGLIQIRDKLFHIISNTDEPSGAYTSSVHKNYFTSSSTNMSKIADHERIETIDASSDLYLTTVWAESDNSLWSGSSNGRLYHFTDGHVQEYQLDSRSQQIRLLFMDSGKNLWAGGYDWGLSKLSYPYESIEQVLPDENRQNINAVVELPTGEIFAGARGGKLYRIDKGNITEYSLESGLKGSGILSLVYTSTGHLLVGTSGHGLAVYKDGRFRYISTDQGLHDPVISQMVEDDYGFLWIGSTRGIFRIELSEIDAWLNDESTLVSCNVYGKAHGLSNIEVSSDYQPGATLTEDGIVQFSTNKGIVWVDPEKVESTMAQPNAIIDSVQVDDLQLKGNDLIRIRSGFHRISFNYSAANFTSPQSIQYRCSLDGFDDDWVYMGRERSIRYSRLPPGDYTFKISASDQNGTWSEKSTMIAVTVVPRWWETIMAQVASLILFVGIIVFIARIIIVRRMQMMIERARQEMMLERERTRISKDLHDDLGARLTEIAFMADLAPGSSSNQSSAESKWTPIAKRARKAVESLDETVWMIDPGKDDLEQFVTYVVQYSTDFCERSDLACRLDIPESLPSINLEGRIRHHLFLAFKEALNNVVRHANASLVKIAISCDSNDLEIAVTDDGKGLDIEMAESGQRHGIGNMRDRMQSIGGEFDIISHPETGTSITFKLTLKEK